jgi:hypothetical protein
MIRRHADLAITAAVAAGACGAAALGAPVALMAVLGLALFAAPGYLLCQILLGPNVSGLERLALIFALSLCVPIIGGLLLHIARVPLHRASWLGLLGGVTVACDLALLAQRLAHLRGNATFSGLQRPRWWLPSPRVVAFGAALAIAACGVGLASAGAAKQSYPGFTQLWLVHQRAGAPTASLGVTNDEGKAARYKLVLFYGARVADSWDIDLSNGQTWRRATKFTSSYTITAKLYRLPDISAAYRYVVLAGPRNQTRPKKQTSPRNKAHGRNTHRR